MSLDSEVTKHRPAAGVPRACREPEQLGYCVAVAMFACVAVVRVRLAGGGW